MSPLLLVLLAAAPLTTVAETSGWERTGRYDEVERLCAAFPKAYPGKVKCEPFGTTPLGRPMLALVASADGTLTPKQVQQKKRPVVLLQGGIHAGEIDGKDAGFWLLRELLDGKVAPGALAKVTLVFVPVFNVDGHERFGPNQRPNQRGPAELGWRVTSQNLNLNRDYAKADAPEMAAMLGLLTRFDPVAYVDLHVTDGAKFQHDVAVVFEPQRLGSPAMQQHGVVLREALFAKLRTQGHKPVHFYPAFDVNDDPSSGFSAGWPPPRFGNAYWALRHRFGVLVETHSWKPYAHRVKTTFNVCLGLLEEAAAHGAEWRTAMLAMDDAAKGLAGQDVVLRWDTTKDGRPIEFEGYAYTRAQSEVSGQPWVRYDENAPQPWKVQLRETLTPALTVRAPKAGYVVPPPHAAWVQERLTRHGLISQRLPKPSFAREVQGMKLEVKPGGGSYEGRQRAAVNGATWAPVPDVALPAGSLFVPIAQPNAELVLHLLEPAAPDSLVSWGFFNAHFEQKEYLEDYLAEGYARELLADAGVKAEFDALLRDAGFAKDPEARLRFFAERHPSWDRALGVLPYYRVDVSPSSTR